MVAHKQPVWVDPLLHPQQARVVGAPVSLLPVLLVEVALVQVAAAVCGRPLLLDLCDVLLVEPPMLRLDEVVDSSPALLDLHLVVCPDRRGVARLVVAGIPAVATCPRGCGIMVSGVAEDFAVPAQASHNQLS